MIYPEKIDIDLNTNCNLNCSFCPYFNEHKQPEFMNIELYKKIIDQITWKASIKLCQRGEPLLSPILIEAIKYANEKGLRTVINTNGLLLNKFNGLLINMGLETLILSDYGLEKQLENGKIFHQLNEWYKLTKNQSIEFIVKTDRPEVWKDLADIMVIPTYYDHSGKKEDKTPLPDWKCEQLFERLIIDPDGKVRCCCGSMHPQKHVGDVNENSILEIWNSEKLTKYRTLHLEGKSHELEMCRKCDYRHSEVMKCQK